MNIYVGGDVSKGYADFCVMDGEGETLLEIQLDDTRQGHRRMSELIRECYQEDGPKKDLEGKRGRSCVRDCDCAEGLVCRKGTCTDDW